MSTTIEQKVVEMRFDNKHFENNVKESLTTLEKLKQKLSFKDASKGFENLNTSANRIDMSGMSKALDTVSSKFSALEIMGVTALVKLSNSAINAGMKMVSALAIDPIKSGLSEYETQIGSVQTILANVGHKGKTLEDVNNALEELNKYADQTIYNFTEMTKNIGLFTNAGVGLDESVSAIKGFSNAAAMAGTDSTRTAGAMYQLSQAMSSGVVRLQDWRSLETANITGERFQEAIKITARAHGIAIDDMIKKEGSLRETLKKDWLTADLMAEALDHYTLSTEKMTEEEVKANKERLKSIGYTEEQIETLFKLGTEATNAATKVKTFSQLWDVLKEAAQSGWAKTWQILIGDFEQAKSLLTPLADFLTGIITKINNFRNKVLESAFGKSFGSLLDNIKKPFEKIENTVKSIQDYANVVDEIINGKWGNGQARWNKLTEAGYDWAHAQNLVNEKLGFSLRRATNYQEAQNGVTKNQEELNKTTADYIVKLSEMTDAELEATLGSKDQVKAFRDLEKAADKTGIPLKEFVENIDKIDGRFLFINSFKNVGKALVDIGKAIKQAWNDIFNPGLNEEQIIEKRANGLFNIIAAVHKLTTKLPKLYDEEGKLTETGEKLVRTFKGVFAVIQIITSIVGGGFKLALAIVKNVLGAFNLDLLDFTAMIGDAAVKVRDWFKENVVLGNIIKSISEAIAVVVESIVNWIRNNESLANGIKNIKEELKGMAEGLANWTQGLKETDNIPKYIAQGLIKGIGATIKLAVAVIIELGKALIEAICDVLGIHSPSRAFYEIGKNIILGLAQGIAEGIGIVFDALKSVGKQLIEMIKTIDFGDVFAVGVAIATYKVIKRILGIFDLLVKPVVGFGDLMQGAAKMIEKFGDGFKNMCDGIGKGASNIGKAAKRNATAKIIKSLALSIGILAASLYIVSKIDSDKLWGSVGAIAALAAILGVLTLVVSKVKEPKQFRKAATAMIILSLSVNIMASALKKLGKIEPERMSSSIKGLASAVIALVALAYAMNAIPPLTLKSVASITFLSLIVAGLATIIKVMSIFDNGNCLNSAKALSLLLLSMSGALLILSIMPATAFTGIGAIALLTLVVTGLAGILLLMNTIDTEGALASSKALSLLLISMSGALVLLSVVGALGPAAFIGIAALATLIAALTAVIIGIGYLMEKVPELESFLDRGLSVLIKIAGGVGEMIGAFVKGALTQMSGALPVIGTNLSLFMTNLAPFITGAKTIDKNVITGVGFLAGAILALTAANLLNGIMSLIPFIGSFSNLGSELSKFMINALPFLIMSKMIDPSVMKGIKSLAEAILILTGANLIDQINRFIGGKGSLGTFGSQLGGLATSLNKFVSNLGTFDESKITSINCACAAIKSLAKAAKDIPNDGGLWGALCGENSLATFGGYLPDLGKNLATFVTSLGTFTKDQVTTVDCAGKAIKALAKAANEIPNEGGLWGAICGENSLATFSKALPGLGSDLAGFVSNLGVFTADQVTTVDCAGKAIKAIADATKGLPNEGGIWQKLAGENGLAKFSKALPGLGSDLSKFVVNLGTFTKDQVNSVNSAANVMKSVASLGKIDIEDTGDGLSNFGKTMIDFAKKLKTFVTEIGEISSDSIDSAIKKTKDLLKMAKTVADTNVSSLKTFGESLKKVATDGVKGFVKEFSGETPKADAKKATKAMLDAAIEGATSKKSEVKKEIKKISKAAVDSMCTEELKKNATAAGKDLVQGFANGIRNNKSLASDAGSSLGKAALKAAKKAIDSNSPSKEAEKIGKDFDLGFVNGIKEYTYKTYDTAYAVGDYAKKGLSRAISAISNVISSDMDTQPTIRPVLDLSDVESGAGYLNSMFTNPSLGVTSNLNAISMGMTSRNQNGDVVSAINKLRKDISNISGTTNNYNVNGITYDDGSNITSAVKTLVRAAKMEGRV